MSARTHTFGDHHPESPFDPQKFEYVHQVGGIQTATLDDPQPNGRPGCRVAMINTGSGLRFTVALDRGGDIVEASYNDTSLAYLTPNGYARPSHAYQQGAEWLAGWPGGLITTCGPRYFGPPREEDGVQTSLHGHHSNTPAAVLAVHNPDPHRGELEMALEMLIRDAQMFGPVIEVHRTIRCTLGKPVIRLHDRVLNRANQRTAHNLLYHMNWGYPLVDRDAELVMKGTLSHHWPDEIGKPTEKWLADVKRLPDPTPDHAGAGEFGLMINPEPADDELCHAGLINRHRNLGLAVRFSPEQLPRLANWHHFGPHGSYVCGIEPGRGSLIGKAADPHPQAEQWLDPGQQRAYDLTIEVLTGSQALDEFQRKHDGPIKPA